MKKVQILGTGCQKCEQLEKNAQMAVHQLGIQAEVVKISDIREITKFGVMMTPGLAIDDEVKSTGKVLSVEEIRDLLQ